MTDQLAVADRAQARRVGRITERQNLFCFLEKAGGHHRVDPADPLVQHRTLDRDSDITWLPVPAAERSLSAEAAVGPAGLDVAGKSPNHLLAIRRRMRRGCFRVDS